MAEVAEWAASLVGSTPQLQQYAERMRAAVETYPAAATIEALEKLLWANDPNTAGACQRGRVFKGARTLDGMLYAKWRAAFWVAKGE